MSRTILVRLVHAIWKDGRKLVHRGAVVERAVAVVIPPIGDDLPRTGIGAVIKVFRRSRERAQRVDEALQRGIAGVDDRLAANDLDCPPFSARRAVFVGQFKRDGVVSGLVIGMADRIAIFFDELRPVAEAPFALVDSVSTSTDLQDGERDGVANRRRFAVARPLPDFSGHPIGNVRKLFVSAGEEQRDRREKKREEECVFGKSHFVHLSFRRARCAHPVRRSESLRRLGLPTDPVSL